MPHPLFDSWCENNYENFRDAIERGNYILAVENIKTARACGFDEHADVLGKELLDTPVSKFIVVSPYVRHLPVQWDV